MPAKIARPSRGIPTEAKTMESIKRPPPGMLAVPIVARITVVERMARWVQVRSIPYACAMKIALIAWKIEEPFMLREQPRGSKKLATPGEMPSFSMEVLITTGRVAELLQVEAAIANTSTSALIKGSGFNRPSSETIPKVTNEKKNRHAA